MPPFLQGWEEHSFLSRTHSEGAQEVTPESVQREEGRKIPQARTMAASLHELKL